MTKILVGIVLLSQVFLFAYGKNTSSIKPIHKVKRFEIESQIKPIDVFEICLNNVVYILITRGYKAGMTVKYHADTNGSNPRVSTCVVGRYGEWDEIP